MSRIRKPEAKKITFAEVYQEYCEMGRSSKAYTTIKKQDSLWKNHLAERFGDRFIDEISVRRSMTILHTFTTPRGEPISMYRDF